LASLRAISRPEYPSRSGGDGTKGGNDVAVLDPPADLGSRGRTLWSEVLDSKGGVNPGERVLLHEGCRLADRLDLFAGILDGDLSAWGHIEWAEEGAGKLVIDAAVAEARAHVAELRQVVKALAMPVRNASASGPSELEKLRARKATG
jgi:hypothetical protein